MEKYNYLNNEQVENTQSRVSKNIALYDEVKECELSRVNNNSNVKIIEQTGKTIDLEKIKKYINDNNSKEILWDNATPPNPTIKSILTISFSLLKIELYIPNKAIGINIIASNSPNAAR